MCGLGYGVLGCLVRRSSWGGAGHGALESHTVWVCGRGHSIPAPAGLRNTWLSTTMQTYLHPLSTCMHACCARTPHITHHTCKQGGVTLDDAQFDYLLALVGGEREAVEAAAASRASAHAAAAASASASASGSRSAGAGPSTSRAAAAGGAGPSGSGASGSGAGGSGSGSGSGGSSHAGPDIRPMLAQIKELMGDSYGDGYLHACLHAYGYNVEQVGGLCFACFFL